MVNVEVTPVVTSQFNDFIRITGEVEAMHDVTLSAEESGRVLAYRVAKGDWVPQDSVIAELDGEILAAQVREAAASAQLADEQYERQRRLWEDEGFGSEIAFLQARTNAAVAHARLNTLEARLARTKIRAPVAGIFDEKYAEVGEMVMPGARIARVVSYRQVKVTGGFPERYALAVAVGARADVTFDVLPGEVFSGRIRYVGASVDPVNRTIPIELVLDNPGSRIKPRMIANVQVARDRLTDVVVVPQQVVLRTEDGFEVFVVADEGGRPVARRRPVTVGASAGNHVVITDGLEPGDLLVTIGQQIVDDGSRVRIVNADAPPEGPARKDSA
ncbi:MAG: efflux RND transporter periplasmic adaptor subunit [Actinomycetota bacterium]|nr:efflux RND transporter periplasmic adaptor subunit [Actinomycetota bacterium]